MITTKKIPVTVYAEMTPNPEVMKFVANIGLIKDTSVEYHSKAEAKGSPLALKLFEFPFVKSVFIVANFISVTKTNSIQWDDVIMELRDFIRTFLAGGGEAITALPETIENTTQQPATSKINSAEATTETEKKIVSILEQYIRPAVEGDGGNIFFRSFENGTVKVSLHGACSGCPSSTLTLKAGIENLLKKMVPEVQEVIAVEE